MCILRHGPADTLIGIYAMRQHALKMYALEGRTKDYKNKWHNHMLRMDSSRLTHNVKKCQQDGRTNF
jgi:hypothetical protein